MNLSYPNFPENSGIPASGGLASDHENTFPEEDRDVPDYLGKTKTVKASLILILAVLILMLLIAGAVMQLLI